jgi:hypothetical protein
MSLLGLFLEKIDKQIQKEIKDNLLRQSEVKPKRKVRKLFDKSR